MISGRIVKIVDDTTLIANVGLTDGVTGGMVFAVVQEADEVSDPESGESLGNWEMIKAHLVVSHVQDRMTTLVSLGSEEIPTTTVVLSELMSRDASGAPIGSRPMSIPVDRNQITGRPSTDVIRLGDTVRQVAR